LKHILKISVKLMANLMELVIVRRQLQMVEDMEMDQQYTNTNYILAIILIYQIAKL